MRSPRACPPCPRPVLAAALRSRWRWGVATALAACLPAFAQGLPPDLRPDLRPELPPELIQALQASKVPAEAVSFMVWSLDGGPPRLQHQADASRLAASVMKLFTTGAALRTLGPAHTWRTEVGLGGPVNRQGALDGPLHVRGGGDPSLVMERVQQMVGRWRAAGLSDIRGDIVVDRGLFSLPEHDAAAFDGQDIKPYNAGADALLLNHQAVTLRFTPDASQPERARVTLEPALHGVSVDASLKLLPQVPCGDWRGALQLSMAPLPGWHHDGRHRWQVQVRAQAPGGYPAACGEREWPLLWRGDGPGDHAARVLTQAWLDAGGRLSGGVREGPWPPGVPVWQSWPSAPLAAVVRDINKFSNNVMARQVFLTLGAMDTSSTAPTPAGTPATLERARAVLTRHVQEATRQGEDAPCGADTLMLDNGSGLSRVERSSARCMATWLRVMWDSPVMPEFIASLPVNGLDGTTRRWQAAVGQAHLKTGSLEGVATVAGYVLGESGRRHVVVGMVNHPRADAARPVLHALVDWARRDR